MSYEGQLKPGWVVCNPLDADTPAQPFNILTLGASHLGFIPGTGTWLETIVPLTTSVSQFSSLWEANAVNSGAGGFAVLGGVRTSDGIVPTANVFGIGGIAICDAPTAGAGTSKVGWAGYLETRRIAGASWALCLESDMLNFGSGVPINPYDMIPDGITPNLWLTSGRPDSTGVGTNPATCAIAIVNNNDTFLKGIVFDADALDGNDGVTGPGIGAAIVMPKGDAILWHEPDTETNIAMIRSETADAATHGASILFADDTVRFDSFDGSVTNFRVDSVASADNFIIVTPGAGTDPPAIQTNATDLILAPVGNVRFGTHSAIGAETVTGFIEIKDFLGNTRKLAVVS